VPSINRKLGKSDDNEDDKDVSDIDCDVEDDYDDGSRREDKDSDNRDVDMLENVNHSKQATAKTTILFCTKGC